MVTKTKRDLIPSARKPYSLAMVLRYLGAATHFNVRGYTVEHYSDAGAEGWAVSLGAWVYASDGLTRWRRPVATRWHRRECLILDLGKAFTLAEVLRLREDDREAKGSDPDPERSEGG